MAKNIFETIQSERTDAMKRAPLPLGLKLLSAIFSINIVITLIILIFSSRDLVEYDAANLVQVITVNVIGLMLCCREAARRMSTRHGGKGGAIVNVSSMAGTLGGRPGSSAYAASKGAVDAFTKGFAREVAAEGIRVNGLRPGMVLTEMTEGRLNDVAFRESIEASIPMGRIGRSGEIADAALWLLSDEASFITGAIVDASGGGYRI